MALLVDDTTQTAIAVAAGSVANATPPITKAADEIAALAAAIRQGTLPVVDRWLKVYVFGSLTVLAAGQLLLVLQRSKGRR